MVRVIAGTVKNKKLLVPASKTRPVTDRIKTVIFDLLQEFVPGAVVLDLYAGSGAYGIEALSRGAEYAVFVDASIDSLSVIKRNLVNCGFTTKTKALKQKIPFNYGEILPHKEYDIVFCDPPFTEKKLFDLELYKELITADNIFMLRYPSTMELKISPKLMLDVLYERKLGLSRVVFLRKSQR